MESSTFSIADYTIFTLSLIASSAIGFYYACTGGKQKTTSEFLFGDKQMKIFPVSMSLIASCTSAVGVLGVSSEVYLNGSMFCITALNMIITVSLTAFIYIPMFHKLNVGSVYEYLELRFNKFVRLSGTVMFILQMMLYMAVALYGPALALSQVTGLSLWASMLGSGIVCTIYTSIGGMKAVIWTDTFQQIVIFCGLLAIIIKGCILAGGSNVVWNIAKANGRAQFFDFNIDPTIRHTFWTLIVGGVFTWLPVYGGNQAMVQRYLSIANLKKSQMAVFITVPIFIGIHILFLLCGLVMYAFYANCDPKLNQRISSYDQILPLFVMEALSDASGLPGLFVACIYSASLSTVSSGLNSIAAVFLEDIIKPLYLTRNKKIIDDSIATSISKVVATLFGVLTIALAFLAGVLGKTILQVALSFNGIVGGPLLGVFTLGMFFPWANAKGASSGLFSSLILVLWMGLGSIFNNPPGSPLKLSIAGCDSNQSLANFSIISAFTSSSRNISNFVHSSEVINPNFGCISYFYKVSYLYYGLIAIITVLIVGNAMSFFTGPETSVNPELYYPIFNKIIYCLPTKWIEKGKYLTKYENIKNLPISQTDQNVIGIKLKNYQSEEKETLRESEV